MDVDTPTPSPPPSRLMDTYATPEGKELRTLKSRRIDTKDDVNALPTRVGSNTTQSTVGQGRKSRKTRKSRKSRKTRKSRK